MAIDLVIFDCDGVLVDSEVISCRAHAETLTHHGYPITPDQVLDRFLGMSDREARLSVEAEIGRRLPDDFEDLMKRAALDRYAGDLRAISHIDIAIDAIGLPKCVASSGTPEKIRHGLTCAGLFDRLAPHIFSATQVTRGKPAPDLFLFAAAQMQVAPRRCLVVEDSVPGVTGARAAGMIVLGFHGGSHCRPGHDATLRAAGAHATFDDMRQLPALLGRIEAVIAANQARTPAIPGDRQSKAHPLGKFRWYDCAPARRFAPGNDRNALDFQRLSLYVSAARRSARPGNSQDSMTPPRKLHIKSYGCQMNVYDAQRMVDTLAAEGFAETATADDADLVILNTCHIREKAAEKVYSELGRLRAVKDEAARNGRQMRIAVAGCVAQAEGAEIIRRAPVVDVVVGPQSYHHLPQLLARAEAEGRAIETEFPTQDKFAFLPPPGREAIRARGISAFVTVQEGCDKFCTFCVVPYTRGAEVSRPVSRIVDDVARLADNGVREIMLIGQNVNAYHGEGPDGRPWTLGRLLHRLAEMPGVVRLRYATSHPCDVDDSLIAAHRDLPALMPFVHLPVQSGSDRILAAMNRRHTTADYRRTIERFRAVRQDIAFSSDFIVGFPGESAEDFAATLALVTQIGYAGAYSFKYSPRPGTPAAEMQETVSATDMDERLARLQELIDSQQSAFNRAAIGATVDVLFERAGRNPGQIVGRTAYLQPAHVMAPPEIIGQVLPVRVESLERYSLLGELAVSWPRPAIAAAAPHLFTGA